MTTPGIGNPYWYEWYVGLNQVINMLNPDNRITYVIFQSDIYDTIDDVVVGYNDRSEEICYQVKHEIDSSNRVNLTFDKLLQQTLYKDETLKKSLIGAIADGWKKASESSNIRITPVLYTNRGLGVKTTNRTFNGIDYKAHPLGDFIRQVKQAVKDIDDINSVKFEDDVEINSQWEEFKSVLELDANTVLEFLKLLEIRSNTLALDAFELQMVNNLEANFSCTTETARKLFNNLVSQLRIWTTTRREKQKVYVEDVYTALSINNDEEIGNHILPPPLPFFNSRKIFCDDLKCNITECDSPIVFISGEPGSGKTSIISYLQSQNNFFTARYHTFRPISPEQRFYDSDDGLCEPSSLWNDLLIQLRNYFKGELAQNNIPVLNALCSVEKMRSEVLRLAELLYIKNKQRIFICIDGIDHAARSKKDITFLSSLYLPEEIPEGVCIIIVGQPSELYPKYPVWLRTENNKVQEFKIPPLETDDIKQLLLSKKTPWVNSQIEALSSAIFSKTKGNNLSVVFAIEETMRCKKVEEVLSVLDTKHITGDINQYYDHIWSHVETRINSMGLGIAFPSLVIASCIVLLNGRIDTALLSNAIKSVNLSNDDWKQLMEMLFPLIIPIKNYNQVSILNNDFRVFLMGIFETNKTKYQAVALELALYLKDCEVSLERSINLIPLLICAKREDLIAEAFDAKFVIESLAERVSLKTLNNYTCLAFSSACKLKNWTVFHSVYLAITTLRQHDGYYEYYSRVYQSNDNSDIKSLQIEEIQVVPLQLKTVKKYYDTLYLIKRLLQENDINSENRARNIYELWLNSYTPLSFIQLLEDDKNKTLTAWEKNTIGNIMELWGNVAAQLGYPNMKIDSASEYSKEEQTGLINYNDAYFKYFFDSGKYNDIPEILKTGVVSYKCLEEKLEKIFLKGLSQYFKELLHILAEKSQNQNNQLMALVCLVVEYKVDVKDIITNIRIDKPKFIMDDQSLNIVLWSILYSYQNYIKETAIIIADIFKLMDNIEKKDKNYEYLKLLVRTGVIVGKSIGAYNSGEPVFIIEKGSLFRIIKDFFLTDIYRTYDFKSAFKILLKLVLHHVAIRDIVDVSFLKEVAEEHLFSHHHIGMFYKTIILDFLEWEHHEYGRIMPDLIYYAGDLAAWKLANKIETSLINSNTYYIACLNIHFLIKTVTDNTNLEILTQHFQSELITQNMWITGINNIITDFDYFKPIHNVLPSPKSLEEFTFNILLEQCTINNIHRMEIASYGLYLLCRQHNCLFEFIAKSWQYYTDLHKKTILMLVERWSQEIPEGFEYLINILGEEYKANNYLNRKLQFYYINKNIYHQKDINMPDIEYKAEPIPYRLPTDVSPLLSDSSLDFCAKRFLTFMSDFMDCPYEDNYDIIDWLNNNCTDDDLSEDTDYFSRLGDGMERLNKRGAIVSQILYGEEKQGRWNDVPLTVKAQCLLSTDDSWIITTPPEICEKSIWDIEKNLEKLLKENEYVKITQLLDTIAIDDIKDEELLLGSCIYYPISYTDGLVYERVAKVFSNFSFINNKEITPTLSAKSLLVYENDLFEPIEEDIYYKGICLMRSIVGTGTCIYGNAFVYPSNFIKEYLNWYPSKNNPFEWIDGTDDTVMRFERKSYPFREATQENYFRQPILCRWICNKAKFNRYLIKNDLKIHIAQKIEPMYKLLE